MQTLLILLATAIAIIGIILGFRELVRLRQDERRSKVLSEEFQALLRRLAVEPHIVLDRSKYPGLFQHHVYYHQLDQEVREWCREYAPKSDIRCWNQPGQREMTYCIFFANDDDKFAFEIRWRGCVN